MPSTPTPSPAVIAAAQHLAAAEQDAAEADQTSAHVEAQVNVLRQRIASANSAKAEIAARRNAGQHHPDDAGNLALIALDREGLVDLLAQAEAAATPLRTAAAAARLALQHAQQHHQHAQDATEEAALVIHAGRLAELLAQTLAELGEVERRTGPLGRRPKWIPAGFYDVIRRQASLAGLL